MAPGWQACPSPPTAYDEIFAHARTLLNFLAHAWLAQGGNDAFLYGNLIADGVKGSDLSGWSPDTAAGIRHHRRVDAVVDAHPVIRGARARAPREGRRYVGIALDLVWDHFVARDYLQSQARDSPDQALIQRCYRLLDERPAPARLASMVPVLIAQDWLNGYADFNFTCSAVAGVGRRLSGPNRLAELVPWLKADYSALEEDFSHLWPELKRQLGV